MAKSLHTPKLYVLPVLYHIKEMFTVQYRQKEVILMYALTWREITLRYLKGTQEKLAVFLSKGGLCEPCQPQPAALTGPAFTDQAESCSALSDSHWPAATYGLCSSWDSSWAGKYWDSTFFSIPVAWKGKTYTGLGLKYVDSEIWCIPYLFQDTKAAWNLKAVFFKMQYHATLGAGQDTNSSLAKSIQLKA